MGTIASRVLLGCLLAATATGCDWGMHRGDAALTGNTYETTIGVGNVGDLGQLWSIDTGQAAPAGPVTASGAVVVVDGDSVVAYEADTGTLRWDTPLPPFADDFTRPRTWAGPAARGGTVHVGYTDPLTSGGAGGGFAQVDATTGTVTTTGGSSGVTGPATFVGDDVWFGWHAVEPLAVGAFSGVEGRLADGRIVRSVTQVDGTGAISGDPAVAGGMAYAARPGGGYVDAIDATGTEGCTDYGAFLACMPLWSAPVAGTAAVAASGATLYASTATGVAAYATGASVRGPDQQPLWSAPVAGPTAVALTPSAGATSVLVGSTDGTLRAFAAAGCGAATCGPLWQAATGGALTAPVIANGVAYVGSADGQVRAYAAAGCGAASCEPLWTAATPGAPRSVIVANGRVFVTTATGDLVAFGPA
jgi:hypothetical protein